MLFYLLRINFHNEVIARVHVRIKHLILEECQKHYYLCFGSHKIANESQVSWFGRHKIVHARMKYMYVCWRHYCQDVYISFTMFPSPYFPLHVHLFFHKGFITFPSPFIIYLLQYIVLKVRHELMTNVHSFPHYLNWNDWLSVLCKIETGKLV